MMDIIARAAHRASAKGGLPIYSAILVRQGDVVASDGVTTVIQRCAALKKFTFAVDAMRFLAAVRATDGKPKLNITDGGKLTVSRGKFRAILPLMDEENYPVPCTVADGTPLPGNFLSQLALIAPFIARDKARPWAMSVKIDAAAMYAANGVVLVRAEFDGWAGRDVVLPLAAVEALLGAKIAPNTLALTDHSASFRYDDMVLVTALLSHKWPDIARLLSDVGEQLPVPDGLADAIERVKPFCPTSTLAIISLTADGRVCTADGDISSSQDGFTFTQDTAFDAGWLLSVLAVANTIDLTKYPAVVPFVGAGIRGVLAGVKRG